MLILNIDDMMFLNINEKKEKANAISYNPDIGALNFHPVPVVTAVWVSTTFVLYCITVGVAVGIKTFAK